MSEQATEPKVIDETAPVPQKILLSKLLEGIVQLIFAGSFPGTHANMVCECVTVLTKLTESEKAKEAETETAHVE